MNVVASLILSLVLLSGSTAVAATDDSFRAIAGSYHGEVFNGFDLDPVVTIFSIDATGRIRGEYVVDEENGEFRGSLSNITFEDERTITVEWTDKFGEGYAVMEFTRDFRSFTGEWSDGSGSSPLPWNGEK